MKSKQAFVRFILLFSALAITIEPASYAHFKLLEPASWLVENDRGDPQKSGPCGGSNTDWGKPSYVVSKAVGGQKLHIKLQETVYHPGHFRVALAVNSPLELPADPVVTTVDNEKGPRSVSAAIQDPAQIPVLADGLFVSTTKPADLTTALETDVLLPNITCKSCTLQVVQFMAEHAFNNPGGYTYHHCSALQITADPSKSLDKGWPAER